MAGTEGQLKLAAIVAIDVAGYSARMLADQAGSAAELGALRAQIEDACSRHGGRLFNSAGDGFMLEFPTASGALLAAEELLAAGGLPIRIGVHLGEVQVTATGDLLGHGVNIAARLQALASPGSALVSDDIRHATRGAVVRPLVAHGAVRLDKMSETIRVFSLGRADSAARTRLAWRRYRLPLAAAALLVVAAAAGAWLWSSHAAKSVAAQARVAVLPFEVPSSDALAKAAADGVANEMATVLNGAQFVTLAADQTANLRGPGAPAAAARLGAAFLMDGSVTHEGQGLKIYARLDDTRAGVTIWSDSASGPDTAPGVLEADVAGRAANIAILARLARRSPGGGNLGPGVLAEFLKADDAITSVASRGSLTARPALQQVVAQAPGFALGHSALALVDALISRFDAPDEHDALARAARGEAATAIALDPHSGEPYLALYFLVPLPKWVDRERVMLQGMAVEPDYQRMMQVRGIFLGDVGRVGEAVAIGRRALGADPTDRQANERYANSLAEAGQFAAAKAAADQAFHVRPDGMTDLERLALVMFYGSAQEAEALLGQSLAHPYPGEGPALDAWSAYLKARRSHTAGDTVKAVAAIKDAADQGSLPIRDAIPAFTVLGDLDAAFADFPLLLQSVENSHVDFLWTPVAAPLLRDPRFWAFAAKMGLTDYWRVTGHWPDACQGAGAPVDCKTRASAATTGRA